MEEIHAENEATEPQEHESLENESGFKDLVTRVISKLGTLDPPLTSYCCIYRVPSKIRKVNEEAYTPSAVSIGPFHNGDKKFQAMENFKLRYLESFLQRYPVRLEDYIGKLKLWEVEIRSCYAETIPLSSDDFVKMILIDACFILELFLRNCFKELSEEDIVLLKPWLINDICQDLVLLENQLPYDVLEALLNVAQTNQDIRHSVIELALNYFEGFHRQHIWDTGPVNHFTDLCRISYLPPDKERAERKKKLIKHLYSASELLEAGLKFKVSSEKYLLDWQYANGVLEIPCFEVDDTTETILRNVIAFEQCHCPYDTYILDYILLMDFLINTTQDVDILVQKGIIVNWLGDTTALTNMINNSLKNHTQSNFSSSYLRLCDDLNAFYNDPWHRPKAIFRREYLSTPWQIASLIAAVLLLFMTFVQTLCSIISLF